VRVTGGGDAGHIQLFDCQNARRVLPLHQVVHLKPESALSWQEVDTLSPELRPNVSYEFGVRSPFYAAWLLHLSAETVHSR